MTRAQRWWLLVAVLVVAALAVSRHTGRQLPTPVSPPAAAATASPNLAPPSPTHTPLPATPSPTPVTGSWSVTFPVDPEPTATRPTPPVPPTPAPAVGLAGCVSLEWSTYQAFGPRPHVVVEVEMVNRCGRDLDPLAVWVRVQGWRQGGLVQEVKGHPFERLDSRGRQRFGLGLPGSRDWYDEIRVEVEEPIAP